MNVERLKPENYEELMDLINMIFSQSYSAFHFQEDIPRAFGPDAERMSWQYGIHADGRLRAAFGSVPYRFQVDGEEFNMRMITDVGVHYHYYGRGFMQAMFAKAFEDMEKEDVDFCLLCGHRERYRYMGFEAAGTDSLFTFQLYNASNRLRALGEKADFSFRKAEANDTESLKAILSYYGKTAMGTVRSPKEVYQVLSLYDHFPYLIFDAAGKCCGYLSYGSKRMAGIIEIGLDDPKTLPRVINSFMEEEKLSKVLLYLSSLDDGLQAAAYEAAEALSSHEICLLQILKPERFLAACLNLKQKRYGVLPQGELVLGTRWGSLLIRNDGRFTVSKTARKPQAVIRDTEIYALLFGPAPAGAFRFTEIPPAYRTWFPLPFYIHRADHY